jgi:hypothetical protein
VSDGHDVPYQPQSAGWAQGTQTPETQTNPGGH